MNEGDGKHQLITTMTEKSVLNQTSDSATSNVLHLVLDWSLSGIDFSYEGKNLLARKLISIAIFHFLILYLCMYSCLFQEMVASNAEIMSLCKEDSKRPLLE